MDLLYISPQVAKELSNYCDGNLLKEVTEHFARNAKVYEKDNKLIASIYPNEEYFGNINYFNGLIYKYNSKVPKNHQIALVTLRNEEFPKNNNRKILRNKVMEEEK